MIYIKKCPNCFCYVESEAIADDTGTYMICNWCGVEINLQDEILERLEENA